MGIGSCYNLPLISCVQYDVFRQSGYAYTDTTPWPRCGGSGSLVDYIDCLLGSDQWPSRERDEVITNRSVGHKLLMH